MTTNKPGLTSGAGQVFVDKTKTIQPSTYKQLPLSVRIVPHEPSLRLVRVIMTLTNIHTRRLARSHSFIHHSGHRFTYIRPTDRPRPVQSENFRSVICSTDRFVRTHRQTRQTAKRTD